MKQKTFDNLKVLIVVPGFPLDVNSIKGGVHAAVSNLLHGFATKEISVRVLSFNNEIKSRVSLNYNNSIEIVYEPEGPFPFHSLNYFFKGPSILKKNIRELNPDILHYQTGNTLFFTRLLGTLNRKSILTIHAFAFEELKTKTSIKDKLTFLFNGIINELIPIRNIIYISQSSKLKHFSKKIKNAALIPNALRPAYFNIPTSTRTNNQLLYIGVINNRKNLIHLLETLSRLQNDNIHFSLNVLGGFKDQDYENQIEEYMANSQLKNNVHFRGWVNQADAIKYIEKSDILVIPSFQETLPMVIAENMAAGKVVVASAVGGIPEMITNEENGFLFNLNDKNALYGILKDLYNNHQLISKVGRNAKEIASAGYHCNEVAAKTIQFYNLVLNQ